MKNIARCARRRRLTERIAARIVCAANAEARGKKISIMAEIKTRSDYVNLFIEGIYKAQSAAIALKSDIIDLLEGVGIDSIWELPVVKPGSGNGVVILNGKTDTDMPKEMINEVRKIRASAAQRRA